MTVARGLRKLRRSRLTKDLLLVFQWTCIVLVLLFPVWFKILGW